MIVKLITCDVPPENRDRFSQGQREWSALSDVEGFEGQVGGWNSTNASQAVIMGFWRDQVSYDEFMRSTHDAVFGTNGQRGSYKSGSAVLWEQLHDMPGGCAKLTDSLGRAALIRTARCTVRADRLEHFQSAQRDVRRSDMRRAKGLLGRVFARDCHAPNLLFVCTFWRTEALHDRYRTEILADLCVQAQPDGDCESIVGMTVRMDASWTVQSELRKCFSARSPVTQVQRATPL